MIKPIEKTVLNEVTETTTSSDIPITNVKKITLLFTRADHSSGSSKFEVLGSVDGTTYQAVMMIQNIAADAGAGTSGEDIGYTRALSTTLSANGSETWALDLKYFNYKDIKIKVTETTDGTHTAKLIMEY
jgi:hypothetical protein